eukprot:Opistho-2@9725
MSAPSTSARGAAMATIPNLSPKEVMILTELKSPLGGLPVGHKIYRRKAYKDVFKGVALVDWLLSHSGATWQVETREGAISFGQRLLDLKLLQRVPDSIDPVPFEDSPMLYTWCDANRGSIMDIVDVGTVEEPASLSQNGNHTATDDAIANGTALSSSSSSSVPEHGDILSLRTRTLSNESDETSRRRALSVGEGATTEQPKAPQPVRRASMLFAGSGNKGSGEDFADRLEQLRSEHNKKVAALETELELLKKQLATAGEAPAAPSTTKVTTETQTELDDNKEKDDSAAPEASAADESGAGAGPPPPPGMGPPPPMGGFGPAAGGPKKPVVKPKNKMRPLFWSRLLIDSMEKSPVFGDTLWHSVEEAPVEDEEFEALFAQKVMKRRRSSTVESLTTKKKLVASLLDAKRAQSLGILMSRLPRVDICQAIVELNHEALSDDIVKAIYTNRGTDEELALIESHVQKDDGMPLDKPEQFLYDLSKVPDLTSRLECWMFTKTFHGWQFDNNQKMKTLKSACEELASNMAIKRICGYVLAFGNYMNGGTTRGQADGFNVEILSKLRDVKTVDNDSSLLDYIVSCYCKKYDDPAAAQQPFPMPDPTAMSAASTVSLEELERDLKQMETKLEACRVMTNQIAAKSDGTPASAHFKDVMDSFVARARDILDAETSELNDVSTRYSEILKYFGVAKTRMGERMPPGDFFTIWHVFCDTFKESWKAEQHKLAKKRFEEIQQRRIERRESQKTRKLNESGTKSSLKQKLTPKKPFM